MSLSDTDQEGGTQNQSLPGTSGGSPIVAAAMRGLRESTAPAHQVGARDDGATEKTKVEARNILYCPLCLHISTTRHINEHMKTHSATHDVAALREEAGKRKNYRTSVPPVWLQSDFEEMCGNSASVPINVVRDKILGTAGIIVAPDSWAHGRSLAQDSYNLPVETPGFVREFYNRLRVADEEPAGERLEKELQARAVERAEGLERAQMARPRRRRIVSHSSDEDYPEGVEDGGSRIDEEPQNPYRFQDFENNLYKTFIQKYASQSNARSAMYRNGYHSHYRFDFAPNENPSPHFSLRYLIRYFEHLCERFPMNKERAVRATNNASRFLHFCATDGLSSATPSCPAPDEFLESIKGDGDGFNMAMHWLKGQRDLGLEREAIKRLGNDVIQFLDFIGTMIEPEKYPLVSQSKQMMREATQIYGTVQRGGLSKVDQILAETVEHPELDDLLSFTQSAAYRDLIHIVAQLVAPTEDQSESTKDLLTKMKELAQRRVVTEGQGINEVSADAEVLRIYDFVSGLMVYIVSVLQGQRTGVLPSLRMWEYKAGLRDVCRVVTEAGDVCQVLSVHEHKTQKSRGPARIVLNEFETKICDLYTNTLRPIATTDSSNMSNFLVTKTGRAHNSSSIGELWKFWNQDLLGMDRFFTLGESRHVITTDNLRGNVITSKNDQERVELYMMHSLAVARSKYQRVNMTDAVYCRSLISKIFRERGQVGATGERIEVALEETTGEVTGQNEQRGAPEGLIQDEHDNIERSEQDQRPDDSILKNLNLTKEYNWYKMACELSNFDNWRVNMPRKAEINRFWADPGKIPTDIEYKQVRDIIWNNIRRVAFAADLMVVINEHRPDLDLKTNQNLEFTTFILEHPGVPKDIRNEFQRIGVQKRNEMFAKLRLLASGRIKPYREVLLGVVEEWEDQDDLVGPAGELNRRESDMDINGGDESEEDRNANWGLDVRDRLDQDAATSFADTPRFDAENRHPSPPTGLKRDRRHSRQERYAMQIRRMESQEWQNLTIRESKLRNGTSTGFGVFHDSGCKKGAALCDYYGQQMSFADFERRVKAGEFSEEDLELQRYYQEINNQDIRSKQAEVNIPVEFRTTDEDENIVILAHQNGAKGFGHRMNGTWDHKCVNVSQKAKVIPVYDNKGDIIGCRNILMLYAARDIEPGEELLRYYGPDYSWAKFGVLNLVCPKCDLTQPSKQKNN